jgi:ElaB/YqjD/DUF883 family membrane-anchored ribosome-binding protein
MSMQNDASVADLRRQSEQTRSDLSRTVGELRVKVSDTASELKTRVSPDHIKQEIRSYVREGQETVVQSIERKVRQNPLQAVAVGAAVAYPLLGILRAIPAPILLIGAGLWFTGKGGQRTVDQAKAKVSDAVGTARDQMSDIARATQATVGSKVSQVTDAVKEAGATLSNSAGSLPRKLKARPTTSNMRLPAPKKQSLGQQAMPLKGPPKLFPKQHRPFKTRQQRWSIDHAMLSSTWLTAIHFSLLEWVWQWARLLPRLFRPREPKIVCSASIAMI